MSRTLIRAAALAALASAPLLAKSDEIQGGSDLPVRYTATALNIDPAVNLSAAFVDLRIVRWSTEAERTQLMAAFRKGQQELVDELHDLPRVGTIKTPDTLAYDLRYARRAPLPDGGAQIVMLTDRPIAQWEAWSNARTLEYPFMIIELRVDDQGRGEGRLNAATKLSFNEKTGNVVMENRASQPVQLTKVKREK